MKIAIYLCLWIHFICSASAAETYYLAIGQTRVLDNANNETVYVANQRVLKLRELRERKLLVRAESLGESDLRIGKQHYQFRVVHKKFYDAWVQIENKVRGIYGLQLELEAHCPVLRGRLLVAEDWQDLLNAAGEKAFHGCEQRIQMQAQLSDDIDLVGLNSLLLAEHKNFLHIVRNRDKLAVLQYAEGNLKLAEAIAKKLGIVKLQSLTPPTQSHYHFELIAVKDSTLKQYGIQLPNDASFNFGGGLDTAALQAKLLSLYNQGHYTHLDRIQLSSTGDRVARFHSGGEIPIKLLGERVSNIIWKAYGFELEIRRLQSYFAGEKVELRISASQLDAASAIDGVPALQKQEYRADLLLDQALQLVFSYRVRGENHSQQGNFGLHQIPFIRQLFAAQQIRMENQNLIFLHKKTAPLSEELKELENDRSRTNQ